MFNLCYNSNNNILDSIYAKAFTRGMTVDSCMADLSAQAVSMNLTLMQGRSGSAMTTIQCLMISTTKQATSIEVVTTARLAFLILFVCGLDFENVYMV